MKFYANYDCIYTRKYKYLLFSDLFVVYTPEHKLFHFKNHQVLLLIVKTILVDMKENVIKSDKLEVNE